MSAAAPPALTVSDRHRARDLAYANGALWAVGNGLLSSTLVVYLALELGAEQVGLGIGLILAAPRIAGLLRMATPALIRLVGDRKRFCLAMYLASAVVLAGLPATAAAQWFLAPAGALAVLVGLWCAYHLLEYMATVALWSWLGDLVPGRIRGRFFGLRQRWMVAAQAVAMIATGLFTQAWARFCPELPRWIGYAVPASLGAAMMIVALVPLAAMPSIRAAEVEFFPGRKAALFAPFRDRRFLRLILFGCWFSFFNGVTQSVQFIYPARVLGASLFLMLALKTAMRGGQLSVSPWLGRMADRHGNKPVMLALLPIIAAGPLFYFFATPAHWWWMIGAWMAWIAYAGLNVCLPNLMLMLSPGESSTRHIAAYYATSGLCLAASTILGGILFDRFGDRLFTLLGGRLVLDFYQASFLLGWVTRTMGVLWLMRVMEPRPRPKGRPAAV